MLNPGLLSLPQGIFPPSLLTLVREGAGRCPAVPLHCVYGGVPENSLNRERETVNLNQEKWKPRGEKQMRDKGSLLHVEKKTHLCKQLCLCSSQAGISLLLSMFWFLSCWAVKWARMWGVSSDLGPFMTAMNCQHCQGNQISQPSNFTRLTLRGYRRLSRGEVAPWAPGRPGPIGSWKNNYKRHSQKPPCLSSQ